ncbi:hypothetical protein L596_027608 [Steinernema carpocapsae]|uniref:peptidylprolyl isomerase n=1 Tax=Steinernema carpocapsae TaxID=34508 RepID=A0A4U5LW02_STECR|nr:hypothetical protein L596_027608 [Steinernema carpocapsae]
MSDCHTEEEKTVAESIVELSGNRAPKRSAEDRTRLDRRTRMPSPSQTKFQRRMTQEAKVGETMDITPNKDGGVLKTITKLANDSEKPFPGDVVYVHYTGKFEDGTVFDSSRKNNEPFRFNLCSGQVIKGWDIAVQTMAAGEVCDVVIQPEYAYGAGGSPPRIPANAVLAFNIELIRFTGEDISPECDGTIYKKVIQAGQRYKEPGECAVVEVHAVGFKTSPETDKFFDKDLTYVLGEGVLEGLPPGVDKALKRMTKGEKARVTLRGPWTYKENAPEGVNPKEVVKFELFLTGFDDAKHIWEMDEEQKFFAAESVKARGNHFFNLQNYDLAVQKYESVVSMLEHDRNVTCDEMKKKWFDLRLLGHLNSAICQLKRNEFTKAMDHCDKVLEHEPNNIKGLFRKGEAYMGRRDFPEAIKMYNRVLELDAKNSNAKNRLQKCKVLHDQELAKQKQRFAKMFVQPTKPEVKDAAQTASVAAE